MVIINRSCRRTGSSARRVCFGAGGRVSGTRSQTISAATAEAAALIQNSSPYPCLTKTPAVTVATENPRLAAQKSNPKARIRCPGGRSATAADPAGRNRSAINPTPTAAAQIAGMVSADPSKISAMAVPRNPISMVWRRPIRSPSQPPSS